MTSTPTVLGSSATSPPVSSWGTTIESPHIELLGASPAEVEARLRKHVGELVDDTLVLETEFVSVVPLG